MKTNEEAEKYYHEKAIETSVPPHLIDGIIRYVVYGIEPGGCLTTVFANDLMEAFGRADIETAAGMKEILTFIYSYSPADCHGNYKRVEDWRGVYVRP